MTLKNNIRLIIAVSGLLLSSGIFAQNPIRVKMNLNEVVDDKLTVEVSAPTTSAKTIVYHIPRTVPGTYSSDNYGQFVDNFVALDKKGKTLKVKKKGENSWEIEKANKLDKITYQVNDTYDIEGKHSIFSPAGTNIEKNKNFMLNLHGFVGYYENMSENPYQISIQHPAGIWGATAIADTDPSATNDIFNYSRYFEVSDNPIMYSKPDYVTFMVDDMEILFAVYSPNGVLSAKDLQPEMEATMKAQKKFLGPINATKKYAILLYLSDMTKPDAKGFGALEHHTSTTVVFPEMMPKAQLLPALIDTVSHEFFHIVTPLSIHAEQIHNFDYVNPLMSEHLWMYEGVTEYFANLFQVNQGLISTDEFLNRMSDKMDRAAQMDDTMSFTTMSANVLEEPYKDQYLNVYDKGALIGMCIDIIIREKSNGERGILKLMQDLSAEYGTEKPFKDADLFPKIVSLTYPEVGQFLQTYVAGTTPINYAEFLNKVGISKGKRQVPGNVFLDGMSPIITVNPADGSISMKDSSTETGFMKSMSLKANDVIVSVNSKDYNLDNIYDLLMSSQEWKNGDAVEMKVKRNGKDLTLKGKAVIPTTEVDGYGISDESKAKLREAWLKG